MAHLQCRFFSQTLGVSTTIEVILPQADLNGQIGMGFSEDKDLYPALYLLHGYSDDESIWCRRTSIERYVAEMGLAVIMPRVDLSYYQDTVDGRRYWTYLSKELPDICEGFFPLRKDRAARYAAGLSMGGYGAFRLGLECPDRFSAVGSLSGALDLPAVAGHFQKMPARAPILQGIFGTQAPCIPDAVNLLKMVETADPSRVLFYQWCGLEDFLLPGNRRFQEAAMQKGLQLTATESPGNHAWSFWDREIQPFLAWLQANAISQLPPLGRSHSRES